MHASQGAGDRLGTLTLRDDGRGHARRAAARDATPARCSPPEQALITCAWWAYGCVYNESELRALVM